MYKKIFHTLVFVSVLISSFTFAGPAFAAGQRRSRARGALVALDTSMQTLTIAPKRGPAVQVKVDQTTSIKRRGRTIDFNTLNVGDNATVSYDPATQIASSVSDTTGQYEIHGTIEAVDAAASTLTVASEEGGNSVTLTADANTVITRNHVTATLADLMVGDKVEARYDSATMLASKIDAESEDGEMHGTVSAVDTAANTVTITPEGGGEDVVLTVSESTVIKRDDTVITLADLVVGDLVEAKYDTVTMIASKIEVEVGEGDNDEDESEIHGTIAAIDTAASTVTITPEGGGEDVVLTVNDETIIKRGDVAITFADLIVGDYVEAKYDPATMVAIKIEEGG